MTAGQPWSVKGIDPKAREAAKDLARRSGMTLGEWLNQVILDDDAPEAPAYAAPTYAPSAAPKPVYRRAELPNPSRDDVLRVSDALDELTSRIEAAESRTARIVGGVDETVSALVARLDGAEGESATLASRFDGFADEARADRERLSERLDRFEHQSAESGSADALRGVEGAIDKVAGHLYANETETREALAALRADLDRTHARLESVPEDNAALIEQVVARIAERLEQAEARTTSAIQGLETSFSHLDSRLGATEARLSNEPSSGGLERIAAQLSAEVDAVRTDMAEKIQAAADGRLDRVERALQEMTGHVRVAERRSADAVERMGHEVLRMADVLSRQVKDVEHRSAAAIEQVGGDVARIADTMEARFNRADAVGAQALEKLGGEIARITDRLAERIGNAERRSAQAIDDVGEQVSRVTERLQDRQERATNDLADRIRQSEERTARLLEDARQRIDQRLEQTQRRAAAAPAAESLDDGFETIAAGSAPLARSDPSQAAFGAPAFSVGAFTPSRFDVADDEPEAFADTRSGGGAAFEAEESAFGGEAFADGAHPEPDLIEPAPMNFVAERFEEPGPILFRGHGRDASSPAPFMAEPFEDEAAAEPEPHAFETRERRSFVLADAEPEADEDAAFAPHGFDRFEPETPTGHVADRPAMGFDDSDFYAGASDGATASDPFQSASLIEPAAADHPAPISGAEHPREEPRFVSSFDEPLPFGDAEANEPAAQHRAMTTRELIEQARAAARAAAVAADPKARKAAARASREQASLALGGSKSKRRKGSSLGLALAASGAAAVLGIGASGYILLAGHPSGALPTRVMAALGLPSTTKPARAVVPPAAAPAPADPMAAVALAPQAAADAGAPIAPAIASGDSGAQIYGDAVRRIEARDFTGLEGLRKAANLGYAPAEFYLAKLYETGEGGVKKDLGEARRWTERAADAGDRKAMHNLALYYVEGSGGPKNTTTAAQWFRRAADLGLVDSQYNLGRLYEEGFGVSQNPAEAYKWYLIAAHAGDTESRASAQRLKGQLSAEAQAAAERAAGAFQAQQQSRPAPTQLAQATAPSDVAGAAIAQRALSRLGYYQGPTDGSPSPALKGAIAAYQRDQGLPVTGAPDAALSQRLAVIAQ